MSRNQSKKIILTGQPHAGKTSLVQYFIKGEPAKKSVSTIGVNVEKKILEIGSKSMDLIIWDIAGERSQLNIPQSYFLGTDGIIYVIDISRPDTFDTVENDILHLKNKLPNAPVVVAANKSDLLSNKHLGQLVSTLPLHPDMVVSAKSGNGVSELFFDLGIRILDQSNISV